MSSSEIVRRRLRRLWLWPLVLVLVLSAAAIAAYELIASPFQAMLLAAYGKRLTFQLEPGPNPEAPAAPAGPYDLRLGYTHLPQFIARLNAQGFQVTHQARVSPEMARVAEFGLFMPYAEKSVAGLELLDCGGQPLKRLRFPTRTYADFAAVPPLVANTLLFIENRELLDADHPQRNPAVEWDRIATALMEKAIQTVDPSRNVPGGSTLATQIEKYRHSPDGLTRTATDKLRQMASASLRAYLDGADTLATRQRIVLDYLNTVPLAAAPGFGEVHGIGDGLTAWFGQDFDTINRLLKSGRATPEVARAYKHVLALLISQRKPSHYLLVGREQLEAHANAHLRLLANMGIISPALRDAALQQRVVFKTGQRRPPTLSFVEHKATSALRVELMQRLGLTRLYDLDRLDLSVRASLHGATQYAVADFLQRLSDPVVVEAAGLYGPFLLQPDNDLTRPIYSFTLYENTAEGALLRVQADNLNQPFDINRGAKLDMGSSAKLRTLITYLQVIAELHAQYAHLSRAELLKLKVADKDLLTRWVVQYLSQTRDRTLAPMLRAAMARQYSASPEETFFTGGGVHRFANFRAEDDTKVMDLWQATRHSVNLPFIRLMRDIVRHFMYRDPAGAARILADPEDPRRDAYLRRFADQEGRAFLARFHKKYRDLKPDQATAALLNHLTANPRRLAAVFRYIEPRADLAAFTRLMKARLSDPAALDAGDFESLYQTYGPERFDLADRGYIAQVHPLELWLVAYLRSHPGASWQQIVAASQDERIEVYDWLLNTSRKNAQDIRILSLLEIDAFQEVHKRWRMLGYPFGSLVPSYASAIGSSADRPAALAELMGVIANRGVKLPAVTITQLEFAADTPYHTRLRRPPPQGERIFPAEIAELVKEALADVVQQGTARRLRGSFPLGDGGYLAIGGKTGTGDHRYEVYAADGTVLESRVMNRTATFAFYLGERFFGVMTVFVPGAAADDYRFTSGLAVQIIKNLEPALRPLLLGNVRPEPGWDEQVRQFEAEPGADGAAQAAPADETPAGEIPAGETPPGGIKPPPPKPRPVTPPKPAAAPAPAPEPPPAPPPPQIDKPDPPIPPQAPPPAPPPPPPAKPASPWSPSPGSGFQFF